MATLTQRKPDAKPDSGAKKAEGPVLLANETAEKKARSCSERCWTSWTMIAAFCILIAIGQPALIAVVVFCQVTMFREVLKLCPYREAPYYKLMGWSTFILSFVASYLALASVYWKPLVSLWLIFYILLICGGLGLVFFVLQVEFGNERRQYQALGWMLWTVGISVAVPLFHVVNMQRNLIWFILPAALVITNDMNAYLFGFLLGKHPLIKISPKKTWEGFIGGGIATVVIAVAVCQGLNYVGKTYNMPGAVASYQSIKDHAMYLAAITSFISPFGGLFASGFKRGHDIKDFGNLIPGHGGITDRMDCQMLNGMLVFAYAGIMQHLGML